MEVDVPVEPEDIHQLVGHFVGDLCGEGRGAERVSSTPRRDYTKRRVRTCRGGKGVEVEDGECASREHWLPGADCRAC